jgi:hypothetical protein
MHCLEEVDARTDGFYAAAGNHTHIAVIGRLPGYATDLV